MQTELDHVPVIDITDLVRKKEDCSKVAQEISRACRAHGFFYIENHGVSESLQNNLIRLSQLFFEKALTEKMRISMNLAGKAWRGYFPVGGELTSGKADQKEGIYFGSEMSADHPGVKSQLPLHGRNLFPADMPEMRTVVLEYLSAMTDLGHRLMEGIALSLGVERNYFFDRYTKDPLILFRIFNYPPVDPNKNALWGVGEHTDYGVLTILKQDDSGGLEVKGRSGWISAKPIPNTFVCNIGDMLDRMTRGIYRSTPHRVKNPAPTARLSFPFFFDPNFNVEVGAIDLGRVSFQDDKDERWDKQSVHEFKGTYGQYLMGKVGKVFPGLGNQVLK